MSKQWMSSYIFKAKKTYMMESGNEMFIKLKI